MTDRFMIDDAGTLIDIQTRDTFDYVSDVCSLLNEQHETIQRLKQNIDELLSVNVEKELLEENKQLKQELKVYRKVANCGNCHYHNYDWFDDGDEFEVCDKGNDVTEGICEEWEELQ